MNILITGGAGFIGANVAAHYLRLGHKVTIFDNLSRKGVQHNIDWLKDRFNPKNIESLTADVKDYKDVESAVKRKKLVFHFAGQTAVTTSIADPRKDFEANALGTFNVLEAVRNQASRATVCYSSTNKVYGAMGRVNAKRRGDRYYPIESASIDESEPLDFYSPYGCSKGAGDQYMHDYHRIFGIKTIVFRQSCIYGAHQFGVEDQGWVAHFTAQSIKGKTLNIFGDGKQVRDMLYITDLVDAFDKAVENIDVTQGQVYNIGGGIENSYSLLQLISLLEQYLGREIDVKYDKERLGDQKVFISNIDKAYRDFGWKPQVSVEAGMKLLYEWLSDFIKEEKPTKENKKK